MSMPPATVAALSSRTLSTPLGQMTAVAGEAALHLLDFRDRRDVDRALGALGPTAEGERHPVLDQIECELEEYFAGERTEFYTPAEPWRGTTFERQAWAALRAVPFGETRSYGQQARSMGVPDAVRAVGRANGMNFLAILVPCHRVIGATGALTGYGGGLDRKRWLIEHERMTLLRR